MNTNEHAGLVVKSNSLINALVRMSLQGNRFLAFAISLLDRGTPTTPGEAVELEIPVAEFATMFDIPRTVVYREVKELVRQLQKKIIQLRPDETISGDDVEVGVISKQRYREHEGRVWIRFDEDIVPHLLGLREQFTTYRLKDVYQFKSAHTWRVYELLKQYKNIGQREFDTEELKRKLGLSGLYDKTNNLIQRVIKPSTEEINSSSDIAVQFSTVKSKRKVVGVLFIIRDNPHTKTPREKVRAIAEGLDTPTTPGELEHALVNEYRVSQKQARQLARLAGGNEKKVLAKLPRIRARYDKLKDQKASLGGYVFKALKDELATKQGELPI